MNNDLLNQNLQKNQYNNNSTKYIENKLIQKGGTQEVIYILTYNVGLTNKDLKKKTPLGTSKKIIKDKLKKKFKRIH